MSMERLFCTAKILTDLRPVFDRVATDGPAALSVVHTLKLSFHHGSEDLEGSSSHWMPKIFKS